MSFAALKARSKTSVQDLQKKLEETKKKGFTKDTRYWKPTRDENGNALAVIRFLSAPEGEEQSYVSYWDHSFEVNKRYYIERSLTTLGQEDPVGEANRALWDTGDEDKKNIARDRKRKLHYVANILVIKDAQAPENNGKVFLYDFGTKIFKKIEDLAQPDFEDETPVDAFNLFTGADFRLKVKKQGDFPNYDDSAFLPAAPLFNGDEAKMEEVWKQCHSLEAEIAPDKFKTYEELKKKFDYVINGTSGNSKSASERIDEDGIDQVFDAFDKNVKKETSPKSTKKEDTDDDFNLDLSNFSLNGDEDDIPF